MSQQKAIFITGAGNGIGRETAVLFAARGWRVGATDINDIDLQYLRGVLGDSHLYQAMDVTKPEQVGAALAAFAAQNGGGIDLVINNAGIADINHFEAVPLARHNAVVAVNCCGVLNVAHQALPYLKQRRQSNLINMCSLASENGVPSEATYSASKFFVRGFTEALNIEWERFGVYVCAILPNFVKTPMRAAAHGAIVDSVGIHLPPADVAAKIWDAAQLRSGKVHWIVDTFRPTLLRTVAKVVPAGVKRKIMKQVAGY